MRLFLHYGDLNDASSLQSIVGDVQPDEIYNLGAQSHVRVSFDIPEYTGEVTGARHDRASSRPSASSGCSAASTRRARASSTARWSRRRSARRRPSTRAAPTPRAKAYAFYVTQNYREAYGMFAVNGILFNHESERRGETFVTRKITRAVGRIKHGLQKELFLGNLDAKRDWGYAADYVEAMWLMLQQARARRLRHRHRRDALGARVPRARRSRTSASTGSST